MVTRRSFLRRSAAVPVPLSLPLAIGTTSTGDGQPTRAPRWTARVESRFLELPSVEGETVVVETGTHAYGFDRGSGARRWRRAGTSGTVATTAGGRAFLVDGDELRAVDVETGETAWATPLLGNAPEFVFDVDVADGTAVATVSSGLFAVDASSGVFRWWIDGDRARVEQVESAPEDLVLVVEDERLRAYDLRDGHPRWEFDAEPVEGVVATTDRSAFVATRDGLVALDAPDGTERWRWDPPDADVENLYGVSGTVAEGVLVFPGVADGREALFALDVPDGAERWRVVPGSGVDPGFGGPTVADGTVYFVAGPREVRAVELSSGDRRWRTDVGAATQTGILDAHGGQVYHPTRYGVHALDAGTGSVQWEHPATFAFYARVLDGSLFVGAVGGRLLAFEPRTGAIDRVVGALPDEVVGIGAGALVAAAVGAAAYRRSGGADGTRLASAFDALPVGTTGDADEKEESTDRIVFEGEFETTAIDAFADAMADWTRATDGPAVLPLVDWGVDPTPWYEVSRCGGTLADGGREWRHVAHALVRASAALERAPVGHGDLRPVDVHFDAGGDGDGTEAVVGGWGLGAFRAAAWGDDPADSPYAAPEREGDPTTATEVYRLGAVGETALAATGAGDQVPDALREVLATATADDPADRYDSLAEFRDYLRWAAFARNGG